VVWGIALNFESQKFAHRYASIYTALVALILIVPLLIYVMLLLQIDESKVKLSLERKTQEIILSMQHYDNSEKVYHFPRYREFKAGLYRDDFSTIFTTVGFKLSSFSDGFHKSGDHYYLVTPLSDRYYFNASYIIVSKRHTAYDIYLVAVGVMIFIIIVLFIFSLLF